MMMTKVINILHRIRKHIVFGICTAFVLLSPLAAKAGYDRDEYLSYCKAEIFDRKYREAGCWSCDIIFALMQAFTSIASPIFNVMEELSKTILLLGAAIWLALYFLKSLGSMTAQDPSKIIDGILTFMFKWSLVYTLIYLGINEIVDKIVNPLLSIGFDIGTEFKNGARFGG